MPLGMAAAEIDHVGPVGQRAAAERREIAQLGTGRFEQIERIGEIAAELFVVGDGDAERLGFEIKQEVVGG